MQPRNDEPSGRQDPLGKAPRLTVLLTEDDVTLRSMLAIVLRREGHRVLEFGNTSDVRNHIEAGVAAEGPSAADVLIITDFRLPDGDGLDLIRGLLRSGNRPNFILLTAFANQDVQEAASDLGALTVLDKPFDFEELRAVVRSFVRLRAK